MSPELLDLMRRRAWEHAKFDQTRRSILRIAQWIACAILLTMAVWMMVKWR